MWSKSQEPITWTNVDHQNCHFVSWLTPCWSVLDFWKINLEKSIWQTGFLVYFKLDFYCLCSLKVKNPVRRTWFFQHDFSKIKYRSIGGLSALITAYFTWETTFSIPIISGISKLFRMSEKNDPFSF